MSGAPSTMVSASEVPSSSDTYHFVSTYMFCSLSHSLRAGRFACFACLILWVPWEVIIIMKRNIHFFRSASSDRSLNLHLIPPILCKFFLIILVSVSASHSPHVRRSIKRDRTRAGSEWDLDGSRRSRAERENQKNKHNKLFIKKDSIPLLAAFQMKNISFISETREGEADRNMSAACYEKSYEIPRNAL